MSNVLIIDDEKNILGTLQRALRMEGFEVVVAGSGKLGLARIQESRPDVVLLDVKMPDLDGIEVLSKIKEHYPGLPVVMMSGHGTIDTAVQATKLGAYDFLEKPLMVDRLLLVVANAMDLSRLREENLSRITIETIQKKVVDYYHLRMADMLSRRRPANIAFPRQVAMYLSRILTEHSLQEIGAAFGGRDHGTVIHACKTVENMMDQDSSIKTAVELLNEQLSQSMS